MDLSEAMQTIFACKGAESWSSFFFQEAKKVTKLQWLSYNLSQSVCMMTSHFFSGRGKGGASLHGLHWPKSWPNPTNTHWAFSVEQGFWGHWPHMMMGSILHQQSWPLMHIYFASHWKYWTLTSSEFKPPIWLITISLKVLQPLLARILATRLWMKGPS